MFEYSRRAPETHLVRQVAYALEGLLQSSVEFPHLGRFLAGRGDESRELFGKRPGLSECLEHGGRPVGRVDEFRQQALPGEGNDYRIGLFSSDPVIPLFHQVTNVAVDEHVGGDPAAKFLDRVAAAYDKALGRALGASPERS